MKLTTPKPWAYYEAIGEKLRETEKRMRGTSKERLAAREYLIALYPETRRSYWLFNLWETHSNPFQSPLNETMPDLW